MFKYNYGWFIFLVACGGDGDSGAVSGKTLRPLNDTGITQCGDFSNISGQNTIDCAASGAGKEISGIDTEGDAVPAGQDALYGHDVNPATNNDNDGHAGFSFTKLDSNGNSLPDSALSWVCVRDNISGLAWEAKTNNNGLGDRDWQYSWFNSNGNVNGGNAGAPDTGSGAGSDNCFDVARCDTEKYVADINSQELCGMSHWRLPSSEELQSIMSLDRVQPAVDTVFFPDTIMNGDYWSSSAVAREAAEAWNVNFYDGVENRKNKGQFASVRLVHTLQRYRGTTFFVPSSR